MRIDGQGDPLRAGWDMERHVGKMMKSGECEHRLFKFGIKLGGVLLSPLIRASWWAIDV